MKRMIHCDIEGMARVGFTEDMYEVYVNTDDGGNIPHFHYRLKGNWSKFHTCIRLDRPEYFHHTGKEGVLSSKQLKKLVKFLNDPVRFSKYIGLFKNNWELICFLWDINNSNVTCDDFEFPDYYKLNGGDNIV